MRTLLYVAFFLSGAAGLIYETIWSRYLGLFVGHSAYAQVIVLTIFLGGLALGAILVGQRTGRTSRPLLWYAGAELGVGLYGLVFHDLYVALEGFAYATLLPALAGSPLLLAVKWGLVAGVILPPSVLLGTTFPFMSAGFLRLFPGWPGGVFSLLYFANSFGAAVGALLAGFLLVGMFGLPGTVLTAAVLNVTVALAAWSVDRSVRVAPEPAGAGAGEGPVVDTTDRTSSAGGARRTLWRLLLGVSLGTALASFIYEIAWIRMLSLVLGTATHSFEIMLSAFILGLALGALWMRARADRIADPLRALGWIQWIMGASALATLPVYVASFGWTAELLAALGRTPEGYTLFNVARYAVALAVMLPSTFCAGTTLPLITRTLFSAGEGERAIGWVYGVNTLGSIVGVVLASLVLLPLLGLQPLLVLGGTLDMALGVLLLGAGVRVLVVGAARGGGDRAAAATESPTRRAQGIDPGTSVRPVAETRGRAVVAALGAAGVALAALLGVRIDRALLTSGVYRTGRLPTGEAEILFYRDGRTATVSTDRRPPGVWALSTNGKPDATLSAGWLRTPEEARATGPAPLSLDEPTQILLALVTLAHNPGARSGLVVGQGSGLSSHMLLGSPHLESLTTVEIEPAMLEASRVFLPATERVFEDPRSHLVLDDAKSVLAQGGPPLDLILSEPSNPWVSGVSSLFSVEFYQRVRDRLAPGGVFGQWLHLYEMDDALVGSVLAALHRSFPSYQVFLVHAADMLIVAGRDPELRQPDWGVFDFPEVARDLSRTFPFRPELLDVSRFLSREALAPLLEGWPPPNSDFYPMLDLGAERTRFLGQQAHGILEAATGPFDLADAFLPPPGPDGEALATPVPQVPMGRALALRNRVRTVLRGGAAPPREAAGAPAAVAPSGTAPGEGREGDLLVDLSGDLELRQALYRHQRAWALVMLAEPPADWNGWLREVLEGAGWGTATGWRVLDSGLLAWGKRQAGALGAPAAVGAAFDLVAGLESRDWATVAAATQELGSAMEAGERWVPPAVVLEAGMAARLLAGRAEDARDFFGRVGPASGLAPEDLRARLMAAHLDRALSLR